MPTVTELHYILQELFERDTTELSKPTGFIKRQRKITAESFAKGLIFGWMQTPDASLSQLQQHLLEAGCQVSIKTIAVRLSTPSTTEFMKELLGKALAKTWLTEDLTTREALPFTKIILLDSTQIGLPIDHQEVWFGGGNQNQKRAAMKIQVCYDWHQGAMDLSLHPAVCNDGKLPVLNLAPNSLVVQDAGFFGIERCKSYQKAGIHWLTRFPSNRQVRYPGQAEQSLWAFLNQFPDQEWVDEQVCLTQAAFPTRLIAQRLPSDIAIQRQNKLIEDTKRRNAKKPTPTALQLCHWFIIATDVPAQQLSPQQAVCLYPSRWQIELLFKLWKQDGALARWGTRNPQRILTEIYAKLLMLFLQHWLLVTTAWLTPDRSLVLASRVIRRQVPRIQATLNNLTAFQAVFDDLIAWLSFSRIQKRLAKPAFFQLIELFFP